MVNVSGISGVVDSRILETLASYRRKGNSVNFGQFLSLTNIVSTSNDAEVVVSVGSKLSTTFR